MAVQYDVSASVPQWRIATNHYRTTNENIRRDPKKGATIVAFETIYLIGGVTRPIFLI